MKYTELPQEKELIALQEHDEEVPADDMHSSMPAKKPEGRSTAAGPVTESELPFPDTSELADHCVQQASPNQLHSHSPRLWQSGKVV